MEKTDAFDALFFGHAARMVRLARLLGDDDPEDVVQESFCKLYAARGRLQHDDHRVLAYLHRIVVVNEFDDGGKSGNIQNGWAWYTGI